MKQNKKKILTRNFIVALGIPSIFIPGLILASILGWNWENDLSRLAARGGYYISEKIFPKKSIAVGALDGDTIMIHNGSSVRLIGIDAPERGEPGHDEAEQFLSGLADESDIELEYDKYQDDSYGRILAYVFRKCTTELGCQNGRRMLNWVMVKEGYAKVVIYEDRKKLKYQDYLLSAENSN